MKFLRKLATGQVALRHVFWLVGVPLSLLWDLTGACMIFGFGITDPSIAAMVIAVFTLATLAIPFVSLAIWRSASNYPRKLWWHTALAWAAKACAAFSALVAALSIVGLAYLGYDFVYALIALG